jgi:RNA polymerase sigma-70 factor (ECF subfamily)
MALSALQIRRVLIDLARRQKVRKGNANPQEVGSSTEPADSTYNPARLAAWTEFHQKVEELPEAEREVLNLVYYMNLTQVEAAKLLGLHAKEVSRRWIRAIRRLPDCEI